jgi:N-methylhydantoinase A
VTDANLFLGYLPTGVRLGGEIVLDRSAAERAIHEHIASQLGLSNEEAAEGIYRIVTERMGEGVRQVTVRQGIDPRGYVLLAFGGAGGTHAVSIASHLGMRGAIIPQAASVFSAFGLLASEVRKDYLTSPNTALSELSCTDVLSQLGELKTIGLSDLLSEGLREEKIEFLLAAEMRYESQVHVVNVPFKPCLSENLIGTLQRAFEERYAELYFHLQKGKRIVLENLRITAVGQIETPAVPEIPATTGKKQVSYRCVRPVYFAGWKEAQIFDLDDLAPGQCLRGPAVLESETTVVVVPPGVAARSDRWGNVLIQPTDSCSEEGL